jgi:DNA-binding transcriptional LysR family regulator
MTYVDGFVAAVPQANKAAYLDHVHVLEDWCLPFSGYHLFYPSRRQSSAAFSLVVEALRYRGRRE